MILYTKDDFEIVTSFSDISIQKTSRKSNLLTKASESSINSIVITDKMANVQWANPAFEDLTGFKIDEIIGKIQDILYLQKTIKRVLCKYVENYFKQKTWKGEIIIKKRWLFVQ
ncbi:PAS domain-containing protein [Arcobacter cryaerophilus gv. pseudocryaerophilus]